MSAVVGRPRDHEVGRKSDLFAVRPAEVEDLARDGDLVLLEKGSSDGETDRPDEVIRDPSSQEQRVGAPGEHAQRVDLAGDFRAPQDRRERALRLEQARELPDLLLEEKARPLLGDEGGHSRHRSVRAVRRAEGVVDVDVGEGREPFRESRIVFFLARVESQVLEEQDLARRESRDELLDLRPDAVFRETDGPRELARHLDRDGRERKLGLRLSFRFSQVRCARDPRAAIDGVTDGRKGLFDPGRVEDLPVGERDVEIDAEEEPLPVEGQVPDRFHRRDRKSEIGNRGPIESRDASHPGGPRHRRSPPAGRARRGGPAGRARERRRGRRGRGKRGEGGDRDPEEGRERRGRGGRGRLRARRDVARGRQHRRGRFLDLTRREG